MNLITVVTKREEMGIKYQKLCITICEAKSAVSEQEAYMSSNISLMKRHLTLTIGLACCLFFSCKGDWLMVQGIGFGC